MKRYLLFGGEAYSRDGGWYDFIEDFDTIEQCNERQRELTGERIRKGASLEMVWHHIVDSDTKEIIHE